MKSCIAVQSSIRSILILSLLVTGALSDSKDVSVNNSVNSTIKLNQTGSSEAYNMLHTIVHPMDDDPDDNSSTDTKVFTNTTEDERTEIPPMSFPTNGTVSITDNSSRVRDFIEKINGNTNDTISPNEQDNDSTDPSQDRAGTTGNSTDSTTMSPATLYTTTLAATTAVPIDNISASTELVTNSSYSSTSIPAEMTFNPLTSAATQTDTTETTEIAEAEVISPAEIKVEAEKDSMPSSIIALVTAVSFAIIAIFGYVSLIVWRRYLEFRYGNRELLVNELEFDTNDLRHFEL